ncbi:MAG: hypothetical protein DCC57_25410 [Chloroflexi bacterium]|nr:MAG: hypothetical protein DCC57_25410 [Chloroflexota bacterium]
MKDQHGITTELFFPVAEADGDAIFKEVEKQAKKITQGTIGLHYTGGTKAMSTHAYRALEKLGSATHQNIVFSYLDAHTRTLMVEPVGDKPKQAISLTRWPEEVAGDQPGLENLAELHKERLRPPEHKPSHLAAAQSIFQLFRHPYDAPNLAKAWRSWLTGQVHPFAKVGRYWKPEADLQALDLPWPEGNLRPFRRNIQEIFGLVGAPRLSIGSAAAYLEIQSGAFCEWLDGLWLEEIVFDLVSGLKPALNLHNIQRSLELEPTGGGLPKCELDIVALRGYQLFGFSCTTSTNADINKDKWMEALLRGQQLGGDEARIALVTFFDRTDALRSEFAQKWQVDEQIKIFGPADFGNLKDAISNWMERV